MSAEAVAQQNRDVKAVIELATMAGGMLLSSGADTKRAEETMEYIMGQVPGGNTVISVISSSIFISYTPEDEGSPVSSIRKIKSWSTDIEKVHVANDVSRRFCAGEINVREAIDILRKTQDKKDIRYGNSLHTAVPRRSPDYELRGNCIVRRAYGTPGVCLQKGQYRRIFC